MLVVEKGGCHAERQVEQRLVLVGRVGCAEDTHLDILALGNIQSGEAEGVVVGLDGQLLCFDAAGRGAGLVRIGAVDVLVQRGLNDPHQGRLPLDAGHLVRGVRSLGIESADVAAVGHRLQGYVHDIIIKRCVGSFHHGNTILVGQLRRDIGVDLEHRRQLHVLS